MADEMHFTLGEGMECLKSIIVYDTIVSFLGFNAMFFHSMCSFKDSF